MACRRKKSQKQTRPLFYSKANSRFDPFFAHKAEVCVYQRHTAGKNRQLELWHGVTSCVWVGSDKIRYFGTVSKSFHGDNPKATSNDRAVFVS